MAEYRTAKSYVDSSQAVDVGLRAHMNKVYGLMSLAMLITGAVAYAVGTTPALVMAIFGTWLQWALNVVQQILKRGKTK
jgi:FtsH-binding integral membrane protein